VDKTKLSEAIKKVLIHDPDDFQHAPLEYTAMTYFRQGVQAALELIDWFLDNPPAYGDRVEVRNRKDSNWQKSTFVRFDVEEGFQCLCVAHGDEHLFPRQRYGTVRWKYMRKIKPLKPLEEG
jgi:hypothetical protein